MNNSSQSIKKFGVILFLISLVGTAICTVSVWILAAIIKEKNIWQPTLIGLGFAVALGGLLISLALYFMFTALSEIIYFLSVISENTKISSDTKYTNQQLQNQTTKRKTSYIEKAGINRDKSIRSNDEYNYYTVNCPNCNEDFSFSEPEIDSNSNIICPNCEKKLVFSIKTNN